MLLWKALEFKIRHKSRKRSHRTPRGSQIHDSVVVEGALPDKQKVRAVKLVDLKLNDPSGSTSVAQQIESRQVPAVETLLNLIRDDL
eukprot:IDg23893t1